MIKTPYIFAAVLSLFLSAWMSWHTGVVNPDGICYLLSAQAIGTIGLTNAMHVCAQAQWPFYPILIYSVSHLTHLSFALTAYSLDALFSLISVLFFLRIVEQLGGTRRTLWLAAFVILSAHHFIDVREYIIRDHGFWAAYLASLYFLLVYFTNSKPRYALAFSASIIIATLFRIEGIIFLFLAPLFILFAKDYSWRKRFSMLVFLNIPSIAAILLAAIAVIFTQHKFIGLTRIPEFFHQITNIGDLIWQRFEHSKQMLVQYVLPLDAVREAGLIWTLTLISWYFLTLINNLTLVYALLVGYAWRSKSMPQNKYHRIVLWGMVGINLFITAVFFASNFFLSKRYVLALSLILMLWVPFAIDDLLKHWQSRRFRYAFTGIVAVMLVYSCIAVINGKHSKLYMHQAGDWLAANIPANANLYSNDLQVMYYSNHFQNSIFHFPRAALAWSALEKGEWQQYDYLALRVNANDSNANTMLQEIPSQPVKVFSNRRGDKVFIYKVHSSV